MGGKPKLGAEYWRRWRADHPEYRERQNRLRVERRRTKGRGDRTEEYRRSSARRLVDRTPIPDLHQGHSLLERAKAIVDRIRRPDQRTHLVDPLYDDMIGEAVVALLVGYDPVMTIQKTLSDEWQWRLRIAPLYDPGDKDEGD